LSGNDNRSETTTTTAVSYTVALSDYNVLVLGATGAVAITLPAATAVPSGRVFNVYKDAAAQTITISAAAGNIDGGASTTLATGAIHAKKFVSDGTNYFTLAAY
jgi:hypothetical protein